MLKARMRRHGHHDQQPVRVADLKGHVQAIERRRRKNPESEAWGRMEARWAAVVDVCRAGLAEVARGRPHVRHERIAWQEVVKVADAVPARDVVNAGLAMYLLAEAEPRRFRSDDAFLMQLARRVRGLADMNAGTYWNHAEQRVKRVYRELPPRAAIACGKLLAEAFGAPGLYLARLERRDGEAKRAEREALHAALEGLK
jgi:predicted transcriptional regulator